MTIQETSKIMDILITAYPKWGVNKQDALILWSQMFVDEPVELVAAAVKSYIITDAKGFPPVIGQIKQIIAKAQADDMSEMEAWNLICKAASNGKYGAYEEYEALPPILQKIVGSPRQIYLWANTSEDEFSTVVASNFMRSYRAELEKAKFERSLPSDVKNLLTGSMKMLGGSV